MQLIRKTFYLTFQSEYLNILNFSSIYLIIFHNELSNFSFFEYLHTTLSKYVTYTEKKIKNKKSVT